LPTLVLSLPSLSRGVTAARFALLGKTLERMLLLIASVNRLIKCLLANFASLGGILSSPVDGFVLSSIKSFSVIVSFISLK